MHSKVKHFNHSEEERESDETKAALYAPTAKQTIITGKKRQSQKETKAALSALTVHQKASHISKISKPSALGEVSIQAIHGKKLDLDFR